LITAFVSVIIGLIVLVWSADRFVAGAASAARHFNVPPLLIGMLVIGFGTSTPEMIVSAMASFEGNPGIAIGNVFGSNIANIGFILALTALISPIAVGSQALRKEMPILIAATMLAIALSFDGFISRIDAAILLIVFCLLTAWSIREAKIATQDSFAKDVEEMSQESMPIKSALLWSSIGLIGLIVSSKALIYGAVIIATSFGISDTIIGLTVVAMGTSLPELASAIAAIRRKEHDLALGNIIGSNLFNTLAVLGVAGMINPLPIAADVISRDLPTMAVLTVALVFMGMGAKGHPGKISRLEGFALLITFILYTVNLILLALLQKGV